MALVDQPQRPCVEVRDIAAKHLDQVRAKLAELQALETSMAQFVGSCNAACAGGAAVDCTILEDLSLASGETTVGVRMPCCG